MNKPDTPESWGQDQDERHDTTQPHKPITNSNRAALRRSVEVRQQGIAKSSNQAALGHMSEDKRQAMLQAKREKKQEVFRIGVIAGGILLLLTLVIFLAVRPKAPIVISDVGFYVTQSAGTSDLYDYRSDFEVKNTSDQKITYIEFKMYYYDKDGNYLYQKDKHYSDLINIGEVKSLFLEENYMPFRGEAVLLPKEVTVTFVDGKTVTFENNVYGATRTYTGKRLKNDPSTKG